MHFCTKCNNMYYIRIGSVAAAAAAAAAAAGDGNAQTTQEPNSAQDPDATTLYHYCRNCGNEVKIEKTICVSKLQLKHRAQSYSNVINKYTKLDPTLPRINNIKCPNSKCRSNSSIAAAIKLKPRATGGLDTANEAEEAEEAEEAYEDVDIDPDVSTGIAANFKLSMAGDPAPREVIYIRYDEVNMKYVYLCAVCDTVWNTSQSNIL